MESTPMDSRVEAQTNNYSGTAAMGTVKPSHKDDEKKIDPLQSELSMLRNSGSYQQNSSESSANERWSYNTFDKSSFQMSVSNSQSNIFPTIEFCDGYESMAGILPDAPPEDYPLFEDMDVDSESEDTGCADPLEYVCESTDDPEVELNAMQHEQTYENLQEETWTRQKTYFDQTVVQRQSSKERDSKNSAEGRDEIDQEMPSGDVCGPVLKDFAVPSDYLLNESVMLPQPCTESKSEKPLEEKSDTQSEILPAAPPLDVKQDLSEKLTVVKKKPYKCAECGQIFQGRNHLERHLYDHLAELTGKTPFSCPRCPGRRFSDMKLHERHHRMGLECDVCGQAFHAAIVIAEHRIRVHTQKKTFACKICSKRFTLATELSHHQKSHNKKKMYGCKVCGKKYKHKDALSIHTRTHTAETGSVVSKHTTTTEEKNIVRKSELKPHLCSQCGQSFSTTDQIDEHNRSIHNKTLDKLQSNSVCDKDVSKPDTLPDSKPFKCEECGASFSLKPALKDHTKRHRVERPFKCRECAYSSSSSSHLERHMKKIHKDKILECKHCDKWFGKKEDLRAHVDKHHHNGHVKKNSESTESTVLMGEKELKS